MRAIDNMRAKWTKTGATYNHTNYVFQTRLCNQRVGSLHCSVVRIYERCLMTFVSCEGLFPCRGQADYRAEVLQHPIET